MRYMAFAVFATFANLAVQLMVFTIDENSVGFAFAVAIGTAVGLGLKYFLDKRWIFDDRSTGFKSHGRTFTLHTGVGVVTTLIFWGSETTFRLVWQTELMRELGAVLGLSVGYVVKYHLDRRYVFTNARMSLRGTG